MKTKELEVFKRAEWVDPRNRFVFWSGGKDSTVALHLALRAWGLNLQVIFVDTGITLPETLEYIQKLTEEWSLNLTVLKPEIDFWDYVAKAGFPIVKALWCRRYLKMIPIRKFTKKRRGWKIQVLGIRKAESYTRKKAWYYQKPFMRAIRMPFTYNLYPILNWSDRQVDDYIERFQIPKNPAYQIYGSSGCYFCPFVKNPRHYLMLKQHHPDLFEKIVEAELVMRKGGTPWPGKSILPILEQQFLECKEKEDLR